MNPKDRIKRYERALYYYGKHSNGETEQGLFLGICNHLDCTLLSGLYHITDYPELCAIRPKSKGAYWWATSLAGVKIRINELKLMIKMAKKATK